MLDLHNTEDLRNLAREATQKGSEIPDEPGETENMKLKRMYYRLSDFAWSIAEHLDRQHKIVAFAGSPGKVNK